MPSDLPDLTHRADPEQLLEWMDAPCSYEQVRDCHRSLERLNALTLASRPTLHWLDSVVNTLAPATPLRILDVGCGGGDMLRRIERWAEHRNIPVSLVGIDLNPYAGRIAREFSPRNSSIRWITGDAFSYTEPVDLICSSLLTHHLPEPTIVRFLAWMEASATLGWFVNDLCRERTPYVLYKLLTMLTPWHPFVRHDGLVSFRRSFREDDWSRMIAAAGISPESVQLERWTPARLCVSRTRP
jgi:SAM-dependent methyltransferase